MGSNQWRRFDKLPESQTYQLVTTGLAAMDERAGQLLPATEHAAAALPDIFVHDPWRPVPAQGGHAAFPAGAFERSAIDCRSDVLTYTSEPLSTELHLAGAITVQLHCTADAPSFDLCAVLSEVNPSGTVYNFSQGYLRIAASDTDLHMLSLQPTCICIPAGSAIRLSISAACFPAYAVNPGTGAAINAGQLIEAQVITITLHGDQSELKLPVVVE
jgi:putative CocE/NonD family hydrolase